MVCYFSDRIYEIITELLLLKLGGYRCCHGGSPLGRTAELLLRWAQMGAFNTLMENGGDNEHRPWMFDDTNTTLSAHPRLFCEAQYSVACYTVRSLTHAST